MFVNAKVSLSRLNLRLKIMYFFRNELKKIPFLENLKNIYYYQLP